ncbi:MAG: protein kinase [Sandaracinaceae bacterium]
MSASKEPAHDPNAVTAESENALRPRPLECPACERKAPPDARYCAGCGRRFGEESHSEHEAGADPLIGRTIADRYRIESLLGRGGMGVVYRVEHVRMGKIMAMKLLSGALARDKEVRKRFKREAEAVSRLDHTNTVQVFDFGESQGMTYLIMEYLAGRDLGQLVKDDGPQPFARVARFASQICGSVQQAHELGIVHRDLKPENVMVIEDRAAPDYVKVLDFGLAKLRETEEAAEKSITRAGSILGTPYYMAPEHIRGEEVDPRSDVYAVGALMYKVLVGVPPFWASSPVGVLTQHLTEEVLPPSVKAPELDVPEEADRILVRTMSKNPDDRYQSMDALRADLMAYLESVGQSGGLESASLPGLSPVSSTSGRQRKVATRGDVDQFERSLRRRSVLYSAFGFLLVVGLIGAGVWAWTSRTPPVVVTETEPNDDLVDADELPMDTTFTAYLGARFDRSRSDADVYVLRSSQRDRRILRLEVSSIPNMDLVVEIFREGVRTPLLVADSGGVGQAEIIPNFPIEGPTHYVRVRELWESGQFPTENVTDAYTIRASLVSRADDEEHEINDSPERAETLTLEAPRRGYIGWGGDEDVYCVSEPVEGVHFEVSGLPMVNLVLEQIDRRTGRVRRIDDGGVGESERGPAVDRAAADGLCWRVAAQRGEGASGGLGNQGQERYTARLAPNEPVDE